MRIYLLFFCFLMLFGCKDNPENQNTTPQTEVVSTPPQVATPSKSIKLISAYTSSESKPSETRAIFDNNINTMWVSKKGMTQGEFIEAYFEPSDQVVHKIGLKMEHVGPMVRIFRYRAFVNGKFIGEYKYSELITINEKIEHLKFQFSLVDLTETAIKYKNDKSIRLAYSLPHQFIGVSEIFIFDEKENPIKVEYPEPINESMNPLKDGKSNSPITAKNESILKTAINRHFANTWKPDDISITNSINLRSDGTFNLESFKELGQESIPLLNTFGHWKIKSENAKEAKIILTGKKDDYSGGTTNFSEQIRVTPEGFFRKNEKENIYISQ